MSKYSPITEFLKNQPSNKRDLTVTFETLEKVLGFSLPKSAHTHQPWWANEKEGSHTQARAWMEAGWKVESVDFSKLRVRFIKESGARIGQSITKAITKIPNTIKENEEIPQHISTQEPLKDNNQRVVLVSCVKSKTSKPMPAQDLYTSDLFHKTSAYARLVGDSWYILSAKYGLLVPNQIIEPYEKTLNKMAAAERKIWASNVLESLKDIVSPGDEVVFLAGDRYRRDLIETLEEWGCKIYIPMEGLSFGRQLSWLKKELRQ